MSSVCRLVRTLQVYVSRRYTELSLSDTLTGINGELKMYAEYISQSEDPKLKQTLKQMRNKAEAAQEQIYQIAREKSYYVPAAPASREEIEQVRSLFKPESML